MELKIKFIGDDDTFYTEVEHYYKKAHPDSKFEFSRISIDKNNDSITVLKKIYNEQTDIIFIDYEEDLIFAQNFSHLINSNAELRKKSFCALHGFKNRRESIQKALLSQVRINHIKGIEIQDIIYDTMSFINVDKAKSLPFVNGDDFDDIELSFDVRVGYLKDTSLHVETNNELVLGDVVELSAHPLDHIANSKRFLVTNKLESNLHYNTRFSYDLEFTYIDDQFFRSSEHYWLDYLSYKDRKDEYEKEKGEEYDQMIRLVKTRKKRIRYIREEVKEWVQKNKNEEVKRTKVLIFDDTLNLIRETRKRTDYNIRYETGLVYDYYQIRRFNPHIIVFNITEKQDEEKVAELFEYLKESDYNPFVIITNTSSVYQYKKCITYPKEILIGTFLEILEKFNSKIDISTNKDRVFFSEDHKNINVKSSTIVEVLKLSESELYFKSNLKIPVWTVFEAKQPIEMLLTVVPDLDNSEFKNDETIYRALINGTTEITKADLRVIINQSFVEEEEVEEEGEESEKNESE